eukprot:TRINITY_DN3451_c0_g1_i1.p1 TRINITY_DN3451_c0_g1~~TRINITY_DN3451_c0_g1_i1.p1  ORF type:complete len:741 (+),score=223.61 TRINITY_DN3451_c0_g1_i1:57-2279(+)
MNALSQKFSKIIAYMFEKSKDSIKYSIDLVDRLCRNYKIDQREDYYKPSAHQSVEDVLLDFVCAIAKRLVQVNHVIWITKKKKIEAPDFVNPQFNQNQFKIPNNMEDEEQIKTHLLQTLMGYLMKIDTILTYVEGLVKKLNRFCCNFSLQKDKTLASSITEPNKLVIFIIDKIKRIESNLSRIEVYVLIIHNLPSNQHIRDLISLKTELSSSLMSEEEYKKKKIVIVEGMVEYHLTKFRPTPFFSLVSPSKSNRHSLSPNTMSAINVEDLLKNNKPQSKDPNSSKSTSSLDNHIQQMRQPLSPNTTTKKTFDDMSLLSPQLTSSSNNKFNDKNNRKTISYGHDNVKRPIVNGNHHDVHMDKNSKVSFEVDKKVELSKDSKLLGIDPLESYKKYVNPNQPISKKSFEAKLNLRKQRSLNMTIEVSSCVVCSSSTFFMFVTIFNQSEKKSIERVSLTFRDNQFIKKDFIANAAVNFPSLFPIKAGSHNFYIDYQLPILKNTTGNEKYQVTIEAFLKGAKKKDKLEIHIPITVVDSANVFANNPQQVFETPFEVLLLREKGEVPKFLESVVKYFTDEDKYLKIQKIFSSNCNIHDVNHIRALYDIGKEKTVFEEVKDHYAFAQALKLFLTKLPEPILSYDLYHDFIQVSDLPQPEERMKSFLKLISSLSTPRKNLFDYVINFLVRLHISSKTHDFIPGAPDLAFIFADAFLRPKKNSIHQTGNKINIEILKELIIDRSESSHN